MKHWVLNGLGMSGDVWSLRHMLTLWVARLGCPLAGRDSSGKLHTCSCAGATVVETHRKGRAPLKTSSPFGIRPKWLGSKTRCLRCKLPSPLLFRIQCQHGKEHFSCGFGAATSEGQCCLEFFFSLVSSPFLSPSVPFPVFLASLRIILSLTALTRSPSHLSSSVPVPDSHLRNCQSS